MVYGSEHDDAVAAAERRLVRAAMRGDRRARNELVARYEPLVRAIVARYFLPGGEREDLAQHGRVGVVIAIGDWDPARGVPFRHFAAMCVRHQVHTALSRAGSARHALLTCADSLDAVPDRDGAACAGSGAARSWGADQELIAGQREELRAVWAALAQLSEIERRATVLAQAGCSHREIARELGAANEKVARNALFRARRRLSAAVTEPEDLSARGGRPQDGRPGASGELADRRVGSTG
jgi:RNA polymerase sporulation-specific sigma factor